MTFRDLLKKINGLQIKYNNGTARVIEVYWDTDRVLIQLDVGVNYTRESRYGNRQVSFVSDGYDQIIVDVSELEKINSR